jgi:hypothetical protein
MPAVSLLRARTRRAGRYADSPGTPAARASSLDHLAGMNDEDGTAGLGPDRLCLQQVCLSDDNARGDDAHGRGESSA